NTEAIGQIGGDAANRHSELAFFRSFLTLVFVFFAQTGSEDFRTIGDRHHRLFLFAIAQERDLRLRAGLAGCDVRDQIVAALHFLAIHGGDGVADLQTRLLGWAAGGYVLHGHARSVNVLDGGIGIGGELDTDGTARHPVIGSNQLVVDLRHRVRWHGKTHAGVRTRLGQNSGVDADDLTRHIHERTTGIARVDGRVGLNERLKLPVGHDVASLGRDDAGGYSFLQSEGTANSEDPVAHLHAVGVAQFGRWEGMIEINLDYGQIRFLIGADQSGVMTRRTLQFALQLHANAIRLLNYVAVGHDVAFGIHNHAGAERMLADSTHVTALTALAAEELVKEILEGRVF